MKRWAGILLPVTAMSFMTTFDGSAVQLALPRLGRELGVDVDEVHWVMSAFLLVSSSTLIQAGRLGDVLGRERVWRAGVLLFVLASAAAMGLPGLWWIVAARALQGLGAALATASSAAILVDAFPGSRGKMLGLGNIAIALGLLAGPPIGALLAETASWRLIFAVAIPIGLGAWLVARRTLPAAERRPAPLAWTSGVLSCAGLGGVVVAGSFGARWGWTAPATLVALGGGAAATAAFFVAQARSRAPLLERAHAGTPMFLSGLTATFLGYAALFTVTISMPFLLLVAQQRPPVVAGLLIGVVPLALSLVAPLAGAATDRIGSRWICTAALATVGVALVVLAAGGLDAGTARIAIGLGLIGAGLGGFEAPNDVDVLGRLPADRLSAGTALINAARNIGMTLGTAAGGTLIAVGMHGAGPEPVRVAHGVRLALEVGAGCAGLGAVAAAFRR
jgi:MFS family permease